MNHRPHTRSRIAKAAWELFHSQGYQETTISDIIAAAEISRGTFYHYFNSKDELLSTLSDLFDDFYRERVAHLQPDLSSCDKLIQLSCSCHSYIARTIPLELLAQLYSSQVITSGDKNLLDRNRFYYQAVQRIVEEGQRQGEICQDMPSYEVVRYYAMCERAIIYDWCIDGGSYDLAAFTAKSLPRMLAGLRP